MKTDRKASSRRNFFQSCLTAVGAAALRGIGCIRGGAMQTGTQSRFRASAEGVPGTGAGGKGDARDPGYLELERVGELERLRRAADSPPGYA